MTHQINAEHAIDACKQAEAKRRQCREQEAAQSPIDPRDNFHDQYERAEDALEKAGIKTADQQGTLITVAEGIEQLHGRLTSATDEAARLREQNEKLRACLADFYAIFNSVEDGARVAACVDMDRIRAALANDGKDGK